MFWRYSCLQKYAQVGNRGHNQPATLISTGRCYMTSQVILTALLLESRKCSLVMLFPCRRTMVMQSVDLTFRRAGKSFSSMRTTSQTRASSTPGRSTTLPLIIIVIVTITIIFVIIIILTINRHQWERQVKWGPRPHQVDPPLCHSSLSSSSPLPSFLSSSLS